MSNEILKGVTRRPPKPDKLSLTGILHDPRFRGILAQALVISLLVGLGAYTISNAQSALSDRGIETGFGFLMDRAGFTIGESPIAFSASDTFLKAYLVGVLNTLRVSLAAIALASILGLLLGVARLSSNYLLNKLASIYIEVFRNTPQLLQIVFWYMLAVNLPTIKQAFTVGDIAYLSNRGLFLPAPGETSHAWIAAVAFFVALILVRRLAYWSANRTLVTGNSFPLIPVSIIILILLPAVVWSLFGTPGDIEIPTLRGLRFSGGMHLTPEFLALFLGLSLYIAAFIAEIVRAGITSVESGQIEAATAIGLKPVDILTSVTLPQALRVIVPPATAQFVSLIKNSSLGVLIGYPELFNLNNTILTASGNTIESIAVMMGVYLSITGSVALVMNVYNRSVQLKER